MKLAIVEDNKMFAQNLLKTLKSWGFEARWYSSFKDFETDSAKYDAAILDVDLGGLNSVELMEKMYLPKTAVIYLTSHKEYVFQAVGKNVYGYLVKGENLDVLKTKLEEIRLDQSPENKMLLETLDGTAELDSRGVSAFIYEYESVYALIPGYSPIRLKYRSLSELQEFLPADYFRINRTAIISLRHVTEIRRHNRTISITGGFEQNVSRRIWKPFLSAWTRFVPGGQNRW